MTTSVNTLFLENLLGEKDYLPLKLKQTELKMFGLKAKPVPKDSELQIALRDHLGDHLMLVNKGETLCLAKKMSPEAWTRLIDEEKNTELRKILKEQLDRHKTKEQKSSMPLKLKATELKILGLKATPAPAVAVLEKLLAPVMQGTGLKLFKKEPKTKTGKETLYLAYDVSDEELVMEAFRTQKKKPFAMKTLADETPLNKAMFLALFNRMLVAGQLQVTKIDDKFNIAEVRPATGSTAQVSPPQTGQSDYELFRAAFDKLDGGRIYVRICNMRRALGWSNERFNVQLRKLRMDGVIQLHAGDVSTMTEDDVNKSYTDENNFFYATITWRKR
jgi:hypothetical protein